MAEWTREDRNQHQQVNHVVDMQAMAYIPRLYDAMIKSIDEDRKTNGALSKLENTFRAELKGYSSVMKDALSKNGKLTSNDYDDLKAHLTKVSATLSQLERDANTRHKKEVYEGFNNQLGVLVESSMERMYQEMNDIATRFHSLGLTFDEVTKNLKKANDNVSEVTKKTKSAIPKIESPIPQFNPGANKKYDLTKILTEEQVKNLHLNAEQIKNIGFKPTPYLLNDNTNSNILFDLNTVLPHTPYSDENAFNALYDTTVPDAMRALGDAVRDAESLLIISNTNLKNQQKQQRQAQQSESISSLFGIDLSRSFSEQFNNRPVIGDLVDHPKQLLSAKDRVKPDKFDHPKQYMSKGDMFKTIMGDPQDNNFFRDLHTTIGSLPIIGSLTGMGSKSERSRKAGLEVGKVLKILPGPLGKIGRIMGLVGAIAPIIAGIYNRMKKASPVLQAISSLFQLALDLVLMPIGNMLGEYLLPLAQTMIEFAIAFNTLFSDFSFGTLLDVFMRLGEIVTATIQTLWNMLFDLLWSVGNAIPDLVFSLIMDGLESLFRSCGMNDVADNIKSFKNSFFELKSTITSWIRALPSVLSGLPNVLLAGLKSLLSGGDFVQGVKNRWNETIGSWTGVKLATGGVVTNPTIALVGEAGPEAVVPLDKAGGIGTTYVININGDVYGVSDLESRIERVIQRTANKAYYR